MKEYSIRSIRTKYSKLSLEAKDILESLDVKDKYGKILERGSTVVYHICELARAGKDISESVDIISHDKWVKLTEIWDKLRSLEDKENELLSDKDNV